MSEPHRLVSVLCVSLLLSACAAPGMISSETLAVDSSAKVWRPAEEQDAARGKTTGPESQPGEWTFNASVYAWLPRKRGVVEAGNRTISLDDPKESTGAFLYLEGGTDRWGFIADVDLLSSRDESQIPTGTVRINEDTVIGELDVSYRLERQETLQFLAGVRLLASSQDIDFPVLPDRSDDTVQIDPIVGAQGTWTLADRFGFRLRGDIGGFGLDSDFTYQMFGVFGWEFAHQWMLTAGYRIVGWEFDTADTRNDIRLAGFLFGVSLHF